ncbi:MAG: MgtC/SapB family protein [Actinobacteria bacterium]|nr:MgtC/SapB family protein [Actinomycetota bacterium]MBU1943920.1 MgtC/SapB family protein [Actinomycetota bacterium]MBU2688558.1 MgtC/SapB family protein [Actinomycetota bacterium]
MSTSWQIVVRILLALAAGALVGFEREITDHPAGIRTHILVTVGACAFTCMSLFGFLGFPDGDRVAAAVVTGIGFIGGGAILRSKTGWVTGLTTAASLWSCAAIGMIFGTGYYAVGFALTAIDLLVLRILDWGVDRVSPRVKSRKVALTVTGRYRDNVFGAVMELLNASGTSPELVRFSRMEEGRAVDLEVMTRLSSRSDIQALTDGLYGVPGVVEVHWG